MFFETGELWLIRNRKLHCAGCGWTMQQRYIPLRAEKTGAMFSGNL